MRGAISKSGGNASLGPMINRTGQGAYCEVGSEGLAEKYRAVIEGAMP
jgi:hypothetical protein